MKHTSKHIRRSRISVIAAALLLAGVHTGYSQNSLPAPGAGGSYQPNVGYGMGPGAGMGWNPLLRHHPTGEVRGTTAGPILPQWCQARRSRPEIFRIRASRK